jgi:Ca2+-binding RTX toxin-like protein
LAESQISAFLLPMLFNLDPLGARGVESVELAGATWTAADIRARVLAAAATDGDDSIRGFTGNDALTGGAGNDTLDGRGGEDSFAGGAGDDTFIIDSAGDTVTEAQGQGIDTVRSAISHALAANVENLTLTGRAAIDGFGNELDNVITGNREANLLLGGAGNDRLSGGLGKDTLSGGEGNDVLHGGRGADILAGGAGNDLLTGGKGADSFVFTGAIGADVITDFRGGEDAGDTLQLDLGEAYDSFAEVIAAASQSGGNTVLDFGSLGTVTLTGVTLSKLAADDFVFR